MKTEHFSIAKMREKIKNETDKRVSKNAARKLNASLCSKGHDISELAIRYAEKDDRVTVRAEDIRKAIKEVEN